MKNTIKQLLGLLRFSPRPEKVSSLASGASVNPKIPENGPEPWGAKEEALEVRWYSDRFGVMQYHVLHPGDKVVIFGNEPGGYDVGEFVGTHPRFTNVPIVDIIDGKSVMCMGITIPFSESMLRILDELKDVEMYNAFVKPEHRIREKYGVQYKVEFDWLWDKLDKRAGNL